MSHPLLTKTGQAESKPQMWNQTNVLKKTLKMLNTKRELWHLGDIIQDTPTQKAPFPVNTYIYII